MTHRGVTITLWADVSTATDARTRRGAIPSRCRGKTTVICHFFSAKCKGKIKSPSKIQTLKEYTARGPAWTLGERIVKSHNPGRRMIVEPHPAVSTDAPTECRLTARRMLGRAPKDTVPTATALAAEREGLSGRASRQQGPRALRHAGAKLAGGHGNKPAGLMRSQACSRRTGN